MKMKIKKIEKIHSQLSLPFAETNRNLILEIFKILETKFSLKKYSKQKLVDLGSGKGQVIFYSALNYGIPSIGVEIDTNFINQAKIKLRNLKKEKFYPKKHFRHIKLMNQDLFNFDLQDFDFIYIYSYPPMQKFLKHVFKTAKSGATIISYRYPMSDMEKILKLSFSYEGETNSGPISVFYYRII